MRVRHAYTAVAMALLSTGGLPLAQAGQPGVYITEFLSRTTDGNFFVEITNLTGAVIDLSGWGYSTNASRSAGEMLIFPHALAPLAAGESVFITSACDNTPACDDDAGEPNFHEIWNLPVGIKVIHIGNDDHAASTLGISSSRFVPSSGGDSLQLFSPSNYTNPVDAITYTTALIELDKSAHVKDTSLLSGGFQNTSNWARSFLGDGYGSYQALGSTTQLEIGNPNALFGPVPEPETYGMMLAGLGLVGWVARRRWRSGAIQGCLG